LRFKAGISQSELALMIGRHSSMVARYEDGDRVITPEIAEAISKVFGIDLSLVLVGKNKQIELTDQEYQTCFKHLLNAEPHYERKRKKPVDQQQADLLKMKWVNPIKYFR